MKWLVLASVLAGACTAGCAKDYKVRVELTSQAIDRRLATGKSDRIDGFVRSADAGAVTLQVDGELETVQRTDIASIDQRLAKRDVTFGAIAAVGGGVLAIGSLFFFDCAQNESPIVCPFKSKQNLYAGVAFVGGISLIGAGLKAVITGRSAQSRIDEILRGTRTAGWNVAPMVAGERGLGAGVVVRY